MPAPSFYAEADYDAQMYAQGFQGDSPDQDRPLDDPISLELDYQDVASLQRHAGKRSTDLVRLYLQEIGRVRLLGRDEEVSEAQRVQRYMRLLEMRNEAALEHGGAIQQYVQLIEAHDRLAAQLGHRPSLERWALEAGVTVSDLKPILAEGKRHWA